MDDINALNEQVARLERLKKLREHQEELEKELLTRQKIQEAEDRVTREKVSLLKEKLTDKVGPYGRLAGKGLKTFAIEGSKGLINATKTIGRAGYNAATSHTANNVYKYLTTPEAPIRTRKLRKEIVEHEYVPMLFRTKTHGKRMRKRKRARA